MCAGMAVIHRLTWAWLSTHSTSLLRKSNVWEPKTTELRWGWCLQPIPDNTILTSRSTATPVRAFKRCSARAALSEVIWLVTFKIWGLSFGSSNTEMLLTGNKFTLGATGKVIFKSSFCWSLYQVVQRADIVGAVIFKHSPSLFN